MFNAENVLQELITWVNGFFGGNALKAVVGISGGKDSSVTAALCARAIGKDRVLGVIMPCGRQGDIAFSYDLARLLGVKTVEINIKNAVSGVLNPIEQAGVALSDGARVNTPARVRMSVLYAVCACVSGLVVNTSNLSEKWVGYGTKFGDGAGDISPLGLLTVSEVKQIGAALGLGAEFLDKPPEDGLSGKTDEDNLGFTYAALDAYIRGGAPSDAALKEKIDRLHALAAHKTSPVPTFDPFGRF